VGILEAADTLAARLLAVRAVRLGTTSIDAAGGAVRATGVETRVVGSDVCHRACVIAGVVRRRAAVVGRTTGEQKENDEEKVRVSSSTHGLPPQFGTGVLADWPRYSNAGLPSRTRHERRRCGLPDV
jgi:hypothetical protein